jgi:lipopolysaccharide/colanic/teichoic acid biosynthesis glycosyltransferase
MKRLFDIVLSLTLLSIFLPILIGVAILLFFFVGRPMLFSQQRPGHNEKIFTIYKFRSMSDERDIDGNLLPDAMRLKGVGKTIRSLSLDELPQLFNVLKGDMSFVGPRPLLVEYLPFYDDRQKKRHSVRPGITGWAQVNGRNAISWEQKFEFDVWYVEHQSFWLDMKILWMTLLKVLKRSDISPSDAVTMERFDHYVQKKD